MLPDEAELHINHEGADGLLRNFIPKGIDLSDPCCT